MASGQEVCDSYMEFWEGLLLSGLYLSRLQGQIVETPGEAGPRANSLLLSQRPCLWVRCCPVTAQTQPLLAQVRLWSYPHLPSEDPEIVGRAKKRGIVCYLKFHW